MLFGSSIFNEQRTRFIYLCNAEGAFALRAFFKKYEKITTAAQNQRAALSDGPY
jgi:hypothetical protein